MTEREHGDDAPDESEPPIPPTAATEAATEAPGLPTRSIPLDSVAISHHLKITYGLDVAAATIRSWGIRGLISRREHTVRRPGADAKGPLPASCASGIVYRYDLVDVTNYLRRRGDIPADDL